MVVKTQKASRLFHCYIAENRYIRSCPKKAGCYASSIVSKLSKKPFSQWQATLCTLWNHTLCRWKSVWRTWTITTQCITSYTINNETFYIFGCSTTLTQCIIFKQRVNLNMLFNFEHIESSLDQTLEKHQDGKSLLFDCFCKVPFNQCKMTTSLIPQLTKRRLGNLTLEMITSFTYGWLSTSRAKNTKMYTQCKHVCC